MTVQRLTAIFATLIVVLMLALPSCAFDVSAYIGGVKAGKIDFKGVKTALDGSPVYGVRLGTNFVPYFGMEHTLAFSSDYLFPKSFSEIRDVKGVVYNSNLIFNIPVGRVVPYLTAGVGLVHQYGEPEIPVGTKFAVNYGGGLKFVRLAGPLGLRFDLRGYTASGIVSDKLNMFEMSGGVIFSFGN
jgi:hypothetical protein